ncbi:MAG: hypothetical protein R3F43_19025 [bacterium]
MPATAVVAFGEVPDLGGAVLLSAAPMDEASLTSVHEVNLYRQSGSTEHLMTVNDGVPDYRLVDQRFVRRVRRAWYPEAVWRFVVGQKPAAASRNIEALAGLDVQGVAVAINPVGPIDIAEAGRRRAQAPLPFARQRGGVPPGCVRTACWPCWWKPCGSHHIAQIIAPDASRMCARPSASTGRPPGPSLAALRRRAAPRPASSPRAHAGARPLGGPAAHRPARAGRGRAPAGPRLLMALRLPRRRRPERRPASRRR